MVVNVVSVSGQHFYSESGAAVVVASGVGVTVQSGVFLASGLYVVADIAESGMGVQIQSGANVIISGQPVTISGGHVFVESGVYLASGLSFVVQSGVQVDSNTLASESAVTLLRRIVKLLEPSAVQDHMQRQMVRIDDFRYSGYAQPAAVTLPFVGYCSGVGVVANVGTAGIYGNNPVLTTQASGGAFVSAYWQAVWTGPVENRWFMMDQARATYAAQIRKNIWVV